ncbi:TPA: Arc family DNA-binding protein [Proteus mirabilis]|nr:Arc family DNA-binding protein [Proteus mirabilis]
MSKYPSQTQDKFTVRFPDGMRDEIAKRAEANGRSMNSEIIQMLQFALDFTSQDAMPATDIQLMEFYSLDRDEQIKRIETIDPEQAKLERFIDKQRDELFKFLSSQNHSNFKKNKK